MAVTVQDIDAYLSEYAQRKSTDDKRIKGLRMRLQKGTEYFDGKGVTSPTETEFEEWRVLLQATQPGNKKQTLMSLKTSRDWVNDVKGFYTWKAGKEQMIIPETEIHVEPSQAVDAVDVEPEKVKLGRQPKPESERRSVKISIYMTQSLYDNIRDLAALSRQDVSTVIFYALSELVDRNADTLNAYQGFLANLAIK